MRTEPRFKWQDGCAVAGIILAGAAMTDATIYFRLGCFAACAICMPLSFFSHKNWPRRRHWVASVGVLLLMAYLGWNAWDASRPKKDVFIEWTQPAPMEFGAALTDHQLNATAKFDGVVVPGKYLYTPTFGTTLPEGMDTLSVEFTPNDLSRFNSSKQQIAVLVKEAIAQTRAETINPRKRPPKQQECQTGSICNQDSPNQGTQTVNNGPPPLKIVATRQIQQPTGIPDQPYATTFTISTNAAAEIGNLRLRCSGPVLYATMGRIDPYELIVGKSAPDPVDPNTVTYPVKPEMLAANRSVRITVFSKSPVTVLSGTANAYPIKF
jgi:hypothetical protein